MGGKDKKDRDLQDGRNKKPDSGGDGFFVNCENTIMVF
jgi:hypothetical protein